MSDISIRRKYIESVSAFMEPLTYFGKIQYGRRAMTGEEVLKISEVTGDSMFLDVTGMDLNEIARDIAKWVLMGEIETGDMIPKSLIASREGRLRAAELFK